MKTQKRAITVFTQKHDSTEHPSANNGGVRIIILAGMCECESYIKAFFSLSHLPHTEHPSGERQ